MMYFLWSAPPHTLGVFKPASRATSTNTTGDATAGFEMDGFESDGFETGAASRIVEPGHFQRGVMIASKSELPRTTKDEPRKRRRRRFITYDRRDRRSPRWKFFHFSSSARHLWKVARHSSCALLDGDDPVDVHIRRRSTCPLDQVISRELILVRFPTPK